MVFSAAFSSREVDAEDLGGAVFFTVTLTPTGDLAAVFLAAGFLDAAFLAGAFFLDVVIQKQYPIAAGLPSKETGGMMGGHMQALVEILERNALTPREDLARMLNLSVEEVEQAIARLEAEGIVLGYQAIINHEKWDTDLVRAMIEVKITPERDGGFDRVASRIAKFEEVQTCYLMSGGYDLLITVEGRNLREVASFVAEKLSTIEAVQSTATRFRLKTYKENGTFHHFEQTAERLSVSP